MDVDLSPASRGFGESIVTLQVKMTARYENILGRTPSNPLGDQASQTGLNLTETIDEVGAAPMIAPDPSPSNMDSSTGLRNHPNMIARGGRLPFYHGCREEENSEQSDLVLVRDYGERWITYTETAA